jgi:hemoglobin-like flavoprotein
LQTLPIETIAIVEATTPDVQAKAAAITFRMWHHLPSEAARRLLFAEFALEGRVVGLLEAIAVAAHRKWPETLPRLLMPAENGGAESIYSTMEPALMLALTEALGKMATYAVLNAWKQAFRFLTEGLAG